VNREKVMTEAKYEGPDLNQSSLFLSM